MASSQAARPVTHEQKIEPPMVFDASRMVLRLVPVAMIVAVPLAGCSAIDSINPFGSGPKYETKILAETPANDIYDQGLARLQKKDDKGAAKQFGELDKQYPFSDWARKGLIMTTYSQYQGGDYDSAIASGKRFYQLYPNAPDAPYALYLQAMSYYQQIPDITRDQDATVKALDLFQQIVAKYPTSEYVDDAKFKIQVARDQLAGKEMSIGRSYLNRRNFVGAINRFREVLAKYQTTRHTEEALERLTEAYLALGITNEAQTAAAVLGHNFPDSPWYKSAFARLQDDGLTPNEDQDSWISRAFRGLKSLG